jgi:signal transduction histidine kinase
MKATSSLAAVLVTIAAATLLFWLVLHQISGLWLDVALHPEVRRTLGQSMEDQKRLRALDPRGRELYRQRFEETRTMVNRMQVIRLNRQAMLRRFEVALLIVFIASALLAAAILWLRNRALRRREREEYLQRVTSLQESARRHAHEIKGPLTAARLEVERLADLARNGAGGEDVSAAEASVAEELERLVKFTRTFSTFGGLGTPVLRRESLGQIVDEFCATFRDAWNGLSLHEDGPDVVACADRDMLRQVLVNLCANSARAGARNLTLRIGREGRHVTMDVCDDGGGVPVSLRSRLFDPYVTTSKAGEGMGLGLSISRKVMLEHGGDLLLVSSSETGTVFRLVFGDDTCN